MDITDDIELESLNVQEGRPFSLCPLEDSPLNWLFLNFLILLNHWPTYKPKIINNYWPYSRELSIFHWLGFQKRALKGMGLGEGHSLRG